MEITHLWTSEVRDDLLQNVDSNEMFSDEEQTSIAAAIRRLPLDSLVTMTADEWDLLNTTDIPIAERSDVALAFLVADLTYGPGQWLDSQEIGQSMGEWFARDAGSQDPS